MKKLDSMPIDERLKLIYSSKELTEKMENAVYFNCDNELSDYLDGIKGVKYSIGMYNQNFMSLNDSGWREVYDRPAYDFLLSLSDLNKRLCFSDKIERKIKQCWSLYYSSSNLFEYECARLVDLYFDYLLATVRYYEDLSYAIHCKDEKSEKVTDLLDLMDCNGYFDGVYVRSDGRLVCEKFLN